MTVAPPPMEARIASPFVLSVIMTGMVGFGTVGSSPMVPGKPATLLVMSTPSAPAAWALATLLLKLHVPRSMSAILPDRAVAMEPQPFGGLVTARSPVTSPVAARSGGKTASLAALTPARAAGALTTSPLTTAALSSDAATLRARADDAGELVT